MEDEEEKRMEEEKELLSEISDQYSKADAAHAEIRDTGFTWDEREELFRMRYKDPKDPSKSVLSSGELTTMAIDGACRVMAQLPSGRFYNTSGKTGSNMLMNLLFENYVLPNAVSGGPMLLKYRVINMYSRVFPYIPVFIDWVVRKRYVGPDMIIIHPRRFRPQPGKTAIEDMDWCFVDAEVSKEFLEEKKKSDPSGRIWRNIDKVLKSYKDGGSGVPETERSPDQKGKTKTGITLRHRFKSNGDWVAYAPFDTDNLVVIDEKGWFTEIPIALKMQYPALDSLGGICDFDRGYGTQKKIDSNDLLYQEGLEMSYKPPIAMDPKNVVLSSIVRRPSAKWFVKNGDPNSIRAQTVSPQGLSTYETSYQINKGRLMSLGADTDTSVPSSIDPGMGKTPEALRRQGARQGSRDAWDTSMTQVFINRVHTVMADMLAKKGVNPYVFDLFGKSIRQIKESYPGEDFSILGTEFEKGIASVNPEYLKGEYRYVSDEGSTLVKNDDTGKKLMGYVDMYNKYPGIAESFSRSGQKLDQGAAFKRAMIDDGIKDSEKIIITSQNPESLPDVGSDGSTIDQPVQEYGGDGQ